MSSIETAIKSHLGLSEKHWEKVKDLFKQQMLNRNDFLLQSGQYAQSMSFIKEGFIRIYAYNNKGSREITQWISTQGMFVTELSSFLFNTPSRWYFQALSPCEIYTIDKVDYNRLGEFVSNWSALEKLFIAKCFVTLENRVFTQLSMTAEEKYQQLMEQNPEILNQVPLQYVASMLGMTPETFSRVRRKLNS